MKRFEARGALARYADFDKVFALQHASGRLFRVTVTRNKLLGICRKQVILHTHEFRD